MFGYHIITIKCIFLLLVVTFACVVLTYWKLDLLPISSRSKGNFDYLFLKGYSNSERHFVANVKITNKNGLGSSSDFLTTEEDLRQRVDRVSSLCRKNHLGKYNWKNNTNDLNLKEPPTPLFSYFFWNRDKRLAWCPVYKAGSTSWLQNMMKLAGFAEETVLNPPKQLSIWAREIYGYSESFGGENLNHSLKLLVVRHPFERLLSAYRDKLANSTVGQEHGTHHFYLKYGKRIVEKFRKDSTIPQIEPTWEEFVRYILRTDLIQYADDHWLPVYYSCTPCLIDYNIVAKTETYFRDQQYIIKKAGLEQILKPRWSHSTVHQNETSRRLQVRQNFFSQLTKIQVQLLYEKYQLDFLLFGYDPKDYIEMARDL